jgi:hypothetical protein
MWITTPHRVDGLCNDRRGRALAFIIDAHASELTRRNIGTCALFHGPYIGSTRFEGKG